MFKCIECGRGVVRRASFTKEGHRATCAYCNAVNVIQEGQSVLDTDTLVQEPEALTFMEPAYEVEEPVVKYPWLETTPEEQLEEMRAELNIPPDVEIPEPGPHAPTVFPEEEPRPGVAPLEHGYKFYRNNMGRLWWHGWDQMGDLLGEELYEEFAYPILTQFADTPDVVSELFTPYGGSRMQGQFLDAVKEHIHQYLVDRGIDVTIGGGKPGAVEYAQQKFPELTDYAYNIMFRKDHPDYLGPMPEHKMDPRAPRQSLEIPYMVELLKKVKEQEAISIEK